MFKKNTLFSFSLFFVCFFKKKASIKIFLCQSSSQCNLENSNSVSTERFEKITLAFPLGKAPSFVGILSTISFVVNLGFTAYDVRNNITDLGNTWPRISNTPSNGYFKFSVSSIQSLYITTQTDANIFISAGSIPTENNYDFTQFIPRSKVESSGDGESSSGSVDTGGIDSGGGSFLQDRKISTFSRRKLTQYSTWTEINLGSMQGDVYVFVKDGTIDIGIGTQRWVVGFFPVFSLFLIVITSYFIYFSFFKLSPFDFIHICANTAFFILFTAFASNFFTTPSLSFFLVLSIFMVLTLATVIISCFLINCITYKKKMLPPGQRGFCAGLRYHQLNTLDQTNQVQIAMQEGNHKERVISRPSTKEGEL